MKSVSITSALFIAAFSMTTHAAAVAVKPATATPSMTTTVGPGGMAAPVNPALSAIGNAGSAQAAKPTAKDEGKPLHVDMCNTDTFATDLAKGTRFAASHVKSILTGLPGRLKSGSCGPEGLIGYGAAQRENLIDVLLQAKANLSGNSTEKQIQDAVNAAFKAKGLNATYAKLMGCSILAGGKI